MSDRVVDDQRAPLRPDAPDRAFDSERAPEIDLIDDCVHCGFCLPTCPTYSLWSEEMDSPRGRIVLMKAGLEEGSELSAPMVEHFDRCLGCMACVTSCPSGVKYDHLIEDTRAQVERNHPRSRRERLVRRAVFSVFPYHRRLRVLALGLPIGRRLPGLLGMLAPRIPLRAAAHRLPGHFAPAGERRGSVALLQGCVQRAFFGSVNEATARVLAAEGFEVHAPSAPECCGALELHAGQESALHKAKATIAALERYDTVVTNSAGCGSGMRDYAHLLRDEPGWAERAERFSGKVRDVTEVLADARPRAERGRLEMKVAYHDACHLAHAQGVREPPRELLRSIPGLELVEPAEWEICCGSAGIYNLVQPEPAAELGERKARNLIDTGAEVIAAANPGCALQIAGHARRLGHELEVVHPMELLWRSING
ncbi:MAG: heterodisulfide reductase-related iron-sulfur binding cluster [Actinomycetota bacterium]|nr:heterodisulfide reductase-related iron-sulfur binding cluster [Actinomycetota bacterium]